MCKVDRKTITHVNSRMIDHVRVGGISVHDARDGKIVVPVHLFGSRQYSMSIDKVNEIYGQARRSVVESTVHKKK